MAKDDYGVIVFRVLTYLYACLKRVTVFNELHFEKVIIGENTNKEYFIEILKMMSEDGLITGFFYIKPWGAEIIKVSNYNELRVTSKGIEYLTENSKMEKIKNYFLEKPNIITDLIKLVF